jgi:hypothetical protein
MLSTSVFLVFLCPDVHVCTPDEARESSLTGAPRAVILPPGDCLPWLRCLVPAASAPP